MLPLHTYNNLEEILSFVVYLCVYYFYSWSPDLLIKFVCVLTIRSKIRKCNMDIFSMLQVKYYRDTYAEHPEDRENIEYKVNLENDDALVTLNGLYDQMKSLGFELSYFRFVKVKIFHWNVSKSQI